MLLMCSWMDEGLNSVLSIHFCWWDAISDSTLYYNIILYTTLHYIITDHSQVRLSVDQQWCCSLSDFLKPGATVGFCQSLKHYDLPVSSAADIRSNRTRQINLKLPFRFEMIQHMKTGGVSMRDCLFESAAHWAKICNRVPNKSMYC